MEQDNKPSLDQLKKTYAQLAFIHQCLTQKGQYFVDEFDIAKDSIRTITEMANKLHEQINTLLPPEPEQPEEISSEKEQDV